MLYIKRITIIVLIGLLTTACFEDLDDNPIATKELNDFVWKGMNYFYLYKDEVLDLSNDRFANNSEYTQYINSFSAPEALFENLIYDRQNIDKFSWITDDYIALEEQFNGIVITSGLEVDYYLEPGSTTNYFAIIRLVMPNSPAANLGLQRGQIIHAVDGMSITENNRFSLFAPSTYTIHLANYNDNGTATDFTDDTIESTLETVTINKVTYTENPIYTTNVFTVNNLQVGYLMYNGFNPEYNLQLNNVFANFEAQNVDRVIVDLRYNPGGSVNTASLLGSMLTGQFNGQIFAKLNYNNELQNNNASYNFSDSFDGTPINSLNLNKIYVITSESSASASEMLINSLQAYNELEVIHLGEQTVGKSQASITVYDSPDFRRNNANPNHTYALQPLVAKTYNKNDISVPANGLTPTVSIYENPINYGVLGNEEEPLLAATLQYILDNGRWMPLNTYPKNKIKQINATTIETEMYLD